MCKRCTAVDELFRRLKEKVELECSWCDSKYRVCEYASSLIMRKQKSGLCDAHYYELMTKASGLDFGRTYSSRKDEERDVDANGWLSNGIRFLEDWR